MNQTKATQIAQAALHNSCDTGNAMRAIIEAIQQHRRFRESVFFREHFPPEMEQGLLLALRLLAEQLEEKSRAGIQ